MKPLSIIIISYNRPGDALELLKNLVELESASQLVQEVVLVNNASTESYAAVEFFANSQTQLHIKILNPCSNLGVARGRNFAIQASQAPLLLMLDDDAVLQNKDALVNVVDAFKDANETKLGALACKVVYYETGEMQQTAFPHKQFHSKKDLSSFETYYFAGCAHVLNRKALEQTGLYPEDFFYGMEEYDLSFRLLAKGYKIMYSSKVVLLHKESPLGRQPQAEKLRMMWVNKTKVAWRYLHLQHFISTALLWCAFFLKKSRYSWRNFFIGWRDILKLTLTEKRRTVNKNVMSQLKALQARLWY